MNCSCFQLIILSSVLFTPTAECQVGEQYDSTNKRCDPCPQDFYKENVGNHDSCQACDAGHVTVGEGTNSSAYCIYSKFQQTRVKSGNFRHEVNSDIHLQTVEIQMRRLLMSRLIRIFIVFLVN